MQLVPLRGGGGDGGAGDCRERARSGAPIAGRALKVGAAAQVESSRPITRKRLVTTLESYIK
jgi:hypothetical protein